jgi:thiamine biosynthesis lipoprotein
MVGPRATSSWRALGTTASIEVTEAHALASARAIVERELAAIDIACSRFRPDSELMRVNAGAGRFVRVGPLLLEALRVALRAARLTDGDVDPTIGEALTLCGYDRDFEALSIGLEQGSPRPLRVNAQRIAGWSVVELDEERASVRIPAGVQLDLGATAKALAADRAASAIGAELGTGGLVNLGGDIAVTGAVPEGGWPIRVTDHHAAPFSAPGQTISIAEGGLATSSTTVRRWRNGPQEMHHILDPASGLPAREVWRTVSVAADSCVDANIASTAAIVRGTGAPDWLASLGLPARLVPATGSGAAVIVGGWPQPPPSIGPPDAPAAERRVDRDQHGAAA